MTKVVVPSNLSTEFVLDATAKKIKLTPDVYDRTKQTGTQPFSTLSGTATAAQIPSLPTSKITSGTFAIAQIPTGTTATTVALGNHSHGIATPTVNGFMSSTDKAKLDGIVDGGGSSFTPVTAPVIDVTEPTDAEQIQGELQKIVDAIKATGVFL